MSLAKILVQNFFGFDFLIFLVAGLNLLCFLAARRYASRLYHQLHLVIFLPKHRNDPEAAAQAVRAVSEEQLVSLRKRSEALYAVFANLTAIFPLLGILGTVLSLLPMVADMANMQQNFFAALTSTFWGLVFAIAFKVLDGFLSARMEDNDKNVALYLERWNQAGDPAMSAGTSLEEVR